MKRFWFVTLVLLLVVKVGADFQAPYQVEEPSEVYIWPMPALVHHGNIEQRVFLSRNFGLKVEGMYKDKTRILRGGFSRFLDVVWMGHVVADTVLSSPSFWLRGIRVTISSPISEIQYGVDESYNISVPFPKAEYESYKSSAPFPKAERYSFIEIEAETVFGALHGLQTLSQICDFDYDSQQFLVRKAPWVISDRPRFPYRGLLIDTSRHFLPIKTIKKILDSMVFTKLNVLHWHVVDKESFPLQIPSYEKLWDGAYSERERYSIAEAAAIVRYAEKRGINVMVELDVPGHAESWGVGYPFLWPSKDCKQPLDISNDLTFKLIEGIISDFSRVFKFKFIHLGGDEVNTSCWTSTPHISKWLNDNNMSETDAYREFVLKVQEIARSHNYEVVNWEETFNTFPDKLNRQTVVHNWLTGVASSRVTEAGFRCIVSNVDAWYLGPVETPWQKFYMNNPLENIEDPKQKELVMGGEVCMWGEKVDTSDFEPTIWPRSAAGAEALWTPYEKQAKNPENVVKRLSRFRCLLNQRGVAAAPLDGLGRAVPKEADSCYRQ